MSSEPTVNILLVDDQPENLLALEAVLSELGYNLIKAHSGREALRALLDDEFALILLDVNMPGLSGFETASMIRQRESTKHVPIIFLTAMYTHDADAYLAYSLGAVDFIIKPFVAEVLRGKVSVFAELHRKSLEVKRQSELIAVMESKRIQQEKDKLETEQQRIKEELLRKEAQRLLLEERSLQLQKADRLKTEFLANMSHEIRTPMNGVIGMAELLLHTPLTSQQQQFAEIIRESAQALLIIINDILDLSKIEAGKLELEENEFNLVSLVEGTAELLVESSPQKNVSLMTYIDPVLPHNLQGDPGRLRQVLLNLISNAMKFTESGEVLVEVKLVDDQAAQSDAIADNGSKSRQSIARVVFSVSDTGIGIPESALAEIFRPFSQADGSTTRKFGGTGLGLSISKRLVELMGGTIGVESQVGKGSKFHFEIPLHVAPCKTVLTASAEMRSKRVLVVDMLDSARRILRSYLSAWGIESAEARNAKDGIEALETAATDGRPFDIVITDMLSPEMGGLTIAEHVHNKLGATKVVLCTALSTRSEIRNYAKAGFGAVLAKPIQQVHLFSCLNSLSDGRSFSPIDEQSDTTYRDYPCYGGQYKILLAEDNPVNQKVAKLQLERLGLVPSIVVNGVQAVEEVLRQRYNLVFMDCQMPEMDGFEAARAIRRAEALTGKHTPIVGLTAHAMEGDRSRCIEAGMDDYLSKPTSLEKLSLVVARYLKEKTESSNDDGKVAKIQEAKSKS